MLNGIKSKSDATLNLIKIITLNKMDIPKFIKGFVKSMTLSRAANMHLILYVNLFPTYASI